jgi:hypothetical protein
MKSIVYRNRNPGSEFPGVTSKGDRNGDRGNSDDAALNIYQFPSGLQPPEGSQAGQTILSVSPRDRQAGVALFGVVRGHRSPKSYFPK